MLYTYKMSPIRILKLMSDGAWWMCMKGEVMCSLRAGNSYILNKKERYIKFSLKLRIFHLNTVKECIVIYNHKYFKVYMTCRGARLGFPVALLGQFKCTGVRTKSNNTTWRVVFRWILKEDESLKYTERRKTINCIYFNIFRILHLALLTYATRIFFLKWPL